MSKISIFSDILKLEEKKPSFTRKDFDEDKNPKKLNLAQGSVMDDTGTSGHNFSLLSKVHNDLLDQNLDKEYPPITGIPDFNNGILDLFFPGQKNEGNYFSAQTATSGSALRIAADLLSKCVSNTIYVSNLTFSFYYDLFSHLNIKTYPYYENKALCFEKFIKFLGEIENGSIINLQLSSHNPTGLDLTKDQWIELANVIKSKNHMPFFDSAYLSYGSGSVEQDLFPVRHFREREIEFLCVFCSGKVFFCADNDCGCILAWFQNVEIRPRLIDNFVILERASYSFPALYSARLIVNVLKTKREEWLNELKVVHERITKRRQMLVDEMTKGNIRKDLVDFISIQKGLYAFFDLSKDQIDLLRNKHSIYVNDYGRVNLTVLTQENVGYFVSSLSEVLK